MNFNSFFEEASKLKTDKNPVLNAEEVTEYSKLFLKLSGKNPSLSYEKMVDFMRYSFLRNEFLTEVLLIGLKNPLEQIGQRQFNCLMKLIACKQAGHKISEALLYDQKVQRGLVKLGEQAVFQLTKEELAEYESQSFFCKNKSQIANFTKAPADTLNQVVQLVGFNKKEEMFSTEETAVILHLVKKAQLYNIPKILPAHLAKYIKTEHPPSVVQPSTPTVAGNLAASFLQIGQPSNSSSTASINRPSIAISTTAPLLSNKDLLGQSQPASLLINKTASQHTAPSSSTATATLFGFNPSPVQPKEPSKLVLETQAPPVPPLSSQSFNLLDGVIQSNPTPAPNPQPVSPPQLTPISIPHLPNTQPGSSNQLTQPVPNTTSNSFSPLGNLPALPPTPTSVSTPSYSNPFAEIESPKVAQPQIKPPSSSIPVHVEAPQQLAPEVKFTDIEPLGAKVQELEREKKNLEIQIIKIRGESDMIVGELKESNTRLRDLLIGTLHLNRQLIRQREETNALIRSLADGNQQSIKELEAAKAEFQAVALTGKIERDKLLTQVRANQTSLVSLVRQKYEELKQFTSSTNKQLADLAKTIDDSKLAVGMEFASQSSPQQKSMIQPHEIKTDLQHDDQQKSWKVFETNMQQQQQPSTSEWPPLEL